VVPKQKNEAGKHEKSIDALLVILFVAFALLLTYVLFSLLGPDWDIMARYFNGYTLLNFIGSGVSPQQAFVGEFSNNLLYYFEPFREPLSMPIFAFLTLFFQKPIFEYLIVVLLGYIFAIYEFSKGLRVDKLIAFAGFLSFYIISVSFENGGEMLSLIFVLLGIMYLLKKDSRSGLFLGIAGIAKYPSLILLPTVLLLGKKEKIAKAVILELIPLLLWCLFDFIVYGNPMYSYVESILNSNVTSSVGAINASSVFVVILYPLLFVIIYFAYTLLKKGKSGLMKELSQKGLLSNYAAKVFVSVIILSAVGYILILPHNDPFTQARYGYLFSTSLLIPLVAIVGKMALTDKRLKYAVAICFVGALLLSSYISYLLFSIPQVDYYNVNNGNGIYTQAYSELAGLGFGNCRFVSNAWIPMIYSGYGAYSPFIIYPSNTITPIVDKLLANEGINNLTYLTQQYEYPIIVFKYIGVQKSLIINLNQSSLAYSSQNFSVYLPQNARCYGN
jgi:hypothetical protein